MEQKLKKNAAHFECVSCSQELKALITEAVREAFNQHIEHCHLQDVGIQNEEHRQHHLIIREFLKNWNHIKTTFMVAIVSILGGSFLSIIWLGLKAKTAGGG